MTATVKYESDLRTTCTHTRSGSEVETDAPVDNNGKGERFSPTDLTATSLGTCMLTIMGIKARSMNVILDGMIADVEKIMKADPRRIGGINLKFHIPATLAGVDTKTRDILKNVALTCPVAKSLHPEIEVNIDWTEWS